MKYLHILLIITVSKFISVSQQVEWAYAFGGMQDDFCNSVVVDSDTSFIVVGLMRDTIYFDPNSHEAYINTPSNNGNLFIAKYHNDKKLIWLKIVERASADVVKRDSHGNIYIAGSFDFNSVFNPGTNQTLLLNDRGECILKLDKNGDFVWFKNVVRDSNVSTIYDFCIDKNEDIIITGSFRSPADFDPGPGVFMLSGLWERVSTFVSKIDKNGNFKWAGIFRNSDTNTGNSNRGISINTDEDANIYIAGNYSGRVDFDPGPGTFIRLNQGYTQTYVVKLNKDMQFMWAKFFPVYLSNAVKNSLISHDKTHFYLCGTFNTAIDWTTTSGPQTILPVGLNDLCIYTMDKNGNILYVKHVGGIGSEFFNDMHFDKNQNLILSGYTNGLLHLDDHNTVVPVNGYENFICTFNTVDFSVERFFTFSRAANTSVVSTSANDLIVCGNFNFQLETYVLPFVFHSKGNRFDGFILKTSNCQPPVYKLFEQTVCQRDTYRFFESNLYASGLYTHKIKNVLGCDSVVIQLNLTVLEEKKSEEYVDTCTSYTWNTHTYTQSGTYTFQTTSGHGCDSIATLHLIIREASGSEEEIKACDTYVWNGHTYTDSGTYTYQTLNALGCDSTAIINLRINPSYSDTMHVTTCDAYTWNGYTYTSAGVYSLRAQSTQGCDSISILVLTIQNTIETQENITACNQYHWNGNTYTQSGEYMFQSLSSSGCDSIVYLYLKVFPNVATTENITVCDSFIWQNQIIDTSGTYSYNETTLNGCDSTMQLILTILPSATSRSQMEACESFTWNGQTYDSSGLYIYQTNNHMGCDSTAFLELTIHTEFNETIAVSSCDQYERNGEKYTQSGIYTIAQTNQYGCDSTTTLQLTIHPSYANNLSLSSCTEVVYQNKTYTASGIYEIPLQSRLGCDSIINLEVKINTGSFEENHSACDSFYWLHTQQQYFDSGIYQVEFTNVYGCDSTYLLNVEILPSYHQTEAREVCESYLWPNNGQMYTKSGLYKIERQTQRGCDSIQILDLTIFEGFRKRDTVVADSDYTWPVNNHTYDTSGEYEVKYISAKGCDSIHYLVLRIENTYNIQFPNIITGGTKTNVFRGFSNYQNVLIKELSIFDRMASRVYHIENTRINESSYGWDGTFRDTDVVPGVYIWTAELLLPDGSIKRMAGDVTVIR